MSTASCRIRQADTRRGALLAVLCAGTLLAAATPTFGVVPQIQGRATALGSPALDITGVRIVGAGFGTPAATSSVRMKTGSVWTTVESTSTEVVRWQDDLIVIKRPRDHINSGIVRVITSGGTSPDAPLHVYRFDTYPFITDPQLAEQGGNAPLALAYRASSGKLYVNPEFASDFHVLTSAGAASPLGAPVVGQPFASLIVADHSTASWALGEDALVDPGGKLWFSQGGWGFVYLGVHPNHSRIVRYDPASGGSFRYYNVPGNDNEVAGLAYDAVRGRIWFTSVQGWSPTAKLTSFDPAAPLWNNALTEWDFPGAPTSLLPLICTGSQTSGCFKEYALPANVFAPAHILVDAAGMVWYTEYWPAGDSGQAHLGRLDPTTETVTQFPLPPWFPGTIGPGPWKIIQLSNGDIIFNTYFFSQLVRMKAAVQHGTGCTELVGGQNPCLEVFNVPGNELAMHSIARDDDDNVWFSLTDDLADPSRPSLGYFEPASAAFTTFPPIGIIFELPNLTAPNPNDPDAPAAFSGAGIVVDPSNRIWIADYLRRQIVRLKKRPN
jgi:streptogramin lyase